LSDGGGIGRLAIVIIAAKGDARIAVRAIKLGAQDYLVEQDLTCICRFNQRSSIIALNSTQRIDDDDLLTRTAQLNQYLTMC
jgi:FixJ family two-component response regulator